MSQETPMPHHQTPDYRDWLQAEQAGNDPLAELLFARLMADLPLVEPSPLFVSRAAQAAWSTRTRRRRARAVTAILAGAGFLTLAYELSAYAVAFIVTCAVAISQALVWLSTSASEGARWWWIAERIGTTVDDAVADPATAAAIAASGILALLAIYALRHLFTHEWSAREPRKVQL